VNSVVDHLVLHLVSQVKPNGYTDKKKLSW
jgi:hypothetical protein